MTEISLSNLNIAELNHLAEEMLPSSDKKIFFEGEINKKYYLLNINLTSNILL